MLRGFIFVWLFGCLVVWLLGCLFIQQKSLRIYFSYLFVFLNTGRWSVHCSLDLNYMSLDLASYLSILNLSRQKMGKY